MTRRQLALAAVVAITVGIIVWLLTGGARTGGDAPRAGAAADAGAAGQGGGAARAGKKRVEPPTGEPDPVGALRLEGQVIDEAQRPVAGATVMLTSNPIRTTTSEGDGSFVFEGLLPRHYRVAAIKGGDRADGIQVRLRDDTEPVILRMHPGITLAVRVLAADTGAPIEGATVTVNGWIDRDDVTDATGLAEVGACASWFNYVTVDADGYSPLSMGLTLPEDPGGRFERTVRLHGGAPVSGTVLDPRGQPVAGAYVNAERADGASSTATRTGDDGTWQFPALAAGSYSFAAAVEGYPAAQQPLELDGKAPTSGVTLRLELGAQIAGIVVDAEGAPVPSARVAAAAGYGATEVSAGPDGRFVITGLGRGSYQVFASDGDRASVASPVDTSKADISDLTVTITDATIRGIVVDTKGEPVAEAEVDAMPVGEYVSGGLLGDSVTDSSGRFVLGPLITGEYRLRARWPDAPRDNTYINKDLATAKTGARDVRIVLEAAGSVRGKVVLAGAPVTRFGISVDEDRGFSSFLTTRIVVSAEGLFERRGMPPGKYGVGIAGDGFATRAVMGVVVEAGEVTDLGTIEVEAGREVKGRVVDADGAPVGGATVAIARWFRPREGGLGLEEDPITGAMRDQRSVETGSDGRFTIRGVGTPEKRPLRIIADHPMKGRSRELELPAGDTEVELTLHAVGSIAGVVTGTTADERLYIKADTGGRDSAGSVHTNGGARWQIDGLIAGTYTVRASLDRDRSSRPVQVEVRAGEVSEVEISIPRGEITLEVRTGDCYYVTLQDPGGTRWIDEALVSAQCDKTDHVTELRELVPGDYQVCVGETCKGVTITASPKVQSLDARRWK